MEAVQNLPLQFTHTVAPVPKLHSGAHRRRPQSQCSSASVALSRGSIIFGTSNVCHLSHQTVFQSSENHSEFTN
jgi:hypothetical protein